METLKSIVLMIDADNTQLSKIEKMKLVLTNARTMESVILYSCNFL